MDNKPETREIGEVSKDPPAEDKSCETSLSADQNVSTDKSNEEVHIQTDQEVTSAYSLTNKKSDLKSDFKFTDHTDYAVVENTSISEQSNQTDTDKHCKEKTIEEEPPSKKSRPETEVNSSYSSNISPAVSTAGFHFIPRTVSKGKGQSLGQKSVRTIKPTSGITTMISNQNPGSTQTCETMDQISETLFKGDNSNKPYPSNSEQVCSSQRTPKLHDSSSSSSSSESENEAAHTFEPKSYDANVVLPEHVVRTWRTESQIKEGEIVEIESESDTCSTYVQPVCFARAVSDFYTKDGTNYLRGCKWSPDGKYLLTNSNDNRLRVYNIPDACDTEQEELRSFMKVKEADTVYDFCWYNKMSSEDSETCSFLTTCKDGPVHLWDMNSGCLKCTYRPYNHLDEMTTAHSLAFSLDGKKLYTGYNRAIRVFDVDRPGRDCIQRNTFLKHQGQPGIISCIAASPQGSGIYAAGSYARAIALYHEPDGSMLCMFQGQQGGVTHIGFSPDGTKLYSGGRKDPEILCWDLRKPGQILFVGLRLCETNQRLFFDQDSSGRHLFSGCHDGTVCIWDTSKSPVKVLPESDPLLKPVLKFKAHGDCVNGISMNHTNNVIATCSGQRHYQDIGESDSDSDGDNTNNDCIENTVKLWKFNER